VEHNSCILTLPNEGRLNWVFEQAGVAYGSSPEPGTDVSREVSREKERRCRHPCMGKTGDGCREENGCDVERCDYLEGWGII
jgi:hypothetical protein